MKNLVVYSTYLDRKSFDKCINANLIFEMTSDNFSEYLMEVRHKFSRIWLFDRIYIDLEEELSIKDHVLDNKTIFKIIKDFKNTSTIYKYLK